MECFQKREVCKELDESLVKWQKLVDENKDGEAIKVLAAKISTLVKWLDAHDEHKTHSGRVL